MCAHPGAPRRCTFVIRNIANLVVRAFDSFTQLSARGWPGKPRRRKSDHAYVSALSEKELWQIVVMTVDRGSYPWINLWSKVVTLAVARTREIDNFLDEQHDARSRCFGAAACVRQIFRIYFQILSILEPARATGRQWLQQLDRRTSKSGASK